MVEEEEAKNAAKHMEVAADAVEEEAQNAAKNMEGTADTVNVVAADTVNEYQNKWQRMLQQVDAMYVHPKASFPEEPPCIAQKSSEESLKQWHADAPVKAASNGGVAASVGTASVGAASDGTASVGTASVGAAIDSTGKIIEISCVAASDGTPRPESVDWFPPPIGNALHAAQMQRMAMWGRKYETVLLRRWADGDNAAQGPVSTDRLYKQIQAEDKHHANVKALLVEQVEAPNENQVLQRQGAPFFQTDGTQKADEAAPKTQVAESSETDGIQ